MNESGIFFKMAHSPKIAFLTTVRAPCPKMLSARQGGQMSL
jgi:hypothetical protein